MPTFCRHNRLIQNCPICSREQQVELRPVVSSSAPRSTQARPPRPEGSGGGSSARRSTGSGGATGLRVRKLGRGGDDGYRSPLVLGLKSSQEAERLADEIAFSATRLRRLETEPPGLYAEVADPSGDIEERTWLAFLIAYFGPHDDADPFAAIRSARTPWASGELPDPTAAPGPRGAHEPGRGTRTLEAYRAWAARAGSQAAACSGEEAWAPERRFARAFERLSLPGLHRDARFDLLVTLGRLGLYDLEPASLVLGADNSVTVGAKRAFGIGDTLLLDRRAGDLASGCGLPLAALDLALHNWQRGQRTGGGLPPGTEADADLTDQVRDALGV